MLVFSSHLSDLLVQQNETSLLRIEVLLQQRQYFELGVSWC